MRILVTGATGVIGRRAVPQLVAAGHDVTAAGRNPERLTALAKAGAKTTPPDLFDREAVARAMCGQDVLINLATHIPSSSLKMLLPWSWKENDRIRREGSAILSDAARAAGMKRFIQESFAPIYADGGDRWLDETWPQLPTRYNRTVLDAEHSAARFAEGGGTSVVLRFAAFYGPDAWQMKDGIASVRRGMYPLPGDPDTYVSFVSHDDAASAVVKALELPNGVYNVSDDEPLTRRELARVLAKIVDMPEPQPMPQWVTKLLGPSGELLSRSVRMSNANLRRNGWSPEDGSLGEGLNKKGWGDRSTLIHRPSGGRSITASPLAAATRTVECPRSGSSSSPPAYRSAPRP